MKINFILENVGNNQYTNTIIQAASELGEVDISPCVFTNRQDKTILKPSLPIFNMSDLYAQPGVGIAMDISPATYMINTVGLDTKVLYVHNLEWTLTNMNTFEMTSKVIDNMDIIICRSNIHAKHMREFFEVEVDAIMPDINWELLFSIVNKHRNEFGKTEIQLSNRLQDGSKV